MEENMEIKNKAQLFSVLDRNHTGTVQASVVNRTRLEG